MNLTLVKEHLFEINIKERQPNNKQGLFNRFFKHNKRSSTKEEPLIIVKKMPEHTGDNYHKYMDNMYSKGLSQMLVTDDNMALLMYRFGEIGYQTVKPFNPYHIKDMELINPKTHGYIHIYDGGLFLIDSNNVNKINNIIFRVTNGLTDFGYESYPDPKYDYRMSYYDKHVRG